MKLTRVQKRTLKYIGDRTFVSQFPGHIGGRQIRNTLEANGLIETCGIEGGPMGFTKYRITQAGRDTLLAKENSRV